MTEIGHHEVPPKSEENIVKEPAKKSRREVLKVASLAGLAALLGRDTKETRAEYNPRIVRVEKYDSSETFSIPPQEYSSEEDGAAALPDHIAQHLTGLIDKVNPILNPAEAVRHIDLLKRELPKKGNLQVYLNAFPDMRPHTLSLSLIPEREYSYQTMKQVEFHEMMHLFESNEMYKGGLIGGFYHYLAESGVDPFKFEALPLEQRRSLQLDETGLFPLFDESSYFDTDSGWQSGHPYEKQSELFASSLTVMKFFPQSLVASMETLRPEDKKKAVEYVGFLLKRGAEVSRDSEAFNKLFSSHLVNYIEKEKVKPNP